jgi:hypothetical protein
MTATARKIETADILPLADYAKLRAERRKKISELKKNRRLEVGPVATFYFESYDTMLHQVHEMLFIEKGGEAQIPDELAAYNPLIPKGAELVATVMFEIDDPLRRARILAGLGGVEHTAFIRVDGQLVKGVPPSAARAARSSSASATPTTPIWPSCRPPCAQLFQVISSESAVHRRYLETTGRRKVTGSPGITAGRGA